MFVRIYDKNLSGSKSEAIYVKLLLSIVINLSIISQNNKLESLEFMILLYDLIETRLN